MTNCPPEYYGDVASRTCKIIENSGTPTTNVEYTECKSIVSLFDMVTEANGVVPFAQM